MRKKLVLEINKHNPLPPFMLEGDNMYLSPSFNIWNMLTEERVTDLNHVPREFDIYSIYHLNNPSQVLLINGNHYTIIDVEYKSYEEAIEDVLKFFRKNKNLDERFLPLCIQKVTLQYVWNRRSFDQYGPWREWFDKETTDSVAIEYRDYLNLELN